MEHDLTLDAQGWEQRGIRARDAGRSAEAEACFTRALARGDRAVSWLGLALAQIDQNCPETALISLQKARQLAPQSGVISHLCDALSGNPTERAPDSFVNWLFDAKAAGFDNHLASLGYQGPEMLRQLAERAAWPVTPTRQILDLGCGTGLSGQPFRPYASQMHGIDLSAGMLRQAQNRGIYDQLIQSEVHAALEGRYNDAYDVVLAADMLIYIGDVSRLFGQIAMVLKPGGSLLFTVETADTGFALTATGRYSHSDAYLRRTVPRGLHCADSIDGMIRVEAGKFTPARAYRFVKTVN